MNYENVKLGALKSHNDPRTFSAARLLKHNLPALPSSSYNMAGLVKKWNMFCNDKCGCCTAAAVGHLDQVRDASVHIDTNLTDNDIMAAYKAVTLSENGKSYVEGDDSTDTGCQPIDMIKYWQKQGEISAYAAIDPSNIEHLKYTIWAFGGAYVAASLPLSVRGQTVWDVAGPSWFGKYRPNSYGGHMIAFIGYGPETFTFVSWGEVMHMTIDFYKTYVSGSRANGEAWMLITPEQFAAASGDNIAGFNCDELKSAMSELKS